MQGCALPVVFALVVAACSTVPHEVSRGDAPKDTPVPQADEPEPPVLTPDVPPAAEVAAPPVQACLAPAPELPEALPNDGRQCVEALIAARERYTVFDPPSPESLPCAVEQLHADGAVYWRGRINGDAKTQTIAFGPIDDGGQRMSMRRITHRDAKGRKVRLEEVWDQYVDGVDTPDCTNTSDTKHTLDRRGWPKRSRKIIESCEGVDAGVITTSRRFTEADGVVEATVSIVDRGTKLRGTAWWMPSPVESVARGTTDHYGDVECSLEILGCEGAVLGRLSGRGDGVHEVERAIWNCGDTSD